MPMRIVVTGADGFIGRNLVLRLSEQAANEVLRITRATETEPFREALASADIVFHLAGVNRPSEPGEYLPGNAGVTEWVCAVLAEAGRRATVVLTSSTQVGSDNPYGRSKLEAERAVERYAELSGARGCVLRLPNVFGKFARPNYNSVVATFCYNIARGLPVAVSNESAPLKLLHVDSVIETMLGLLAPSERTGIVECAPIYASTVGEIASMLREFAASRTTLNVSGVGAGLARALYSTYVSYLPPSAFAYPVTIHKDRRGTFAELFRTADSGQWSFFTAGPGVTRGGHYHHTKTEKFVVVSGRARFVFRHTISGESVVIDVEGSAPRFVETAPGWAHSITNIGHDDLIALLWANEVFEPTRADTVSIEVEQ